MKQTEFKRRGGGMSQCEAILLRLSEARGGNFYGWVPMPTLCEVSGAYAVHSRISDLRKRGHKIEQRSTRLADGTVASEYRLKPEEET